MIVHNVFWGALSQSQIFDDTDITDLGDRVKYLDVISNAQGYVFTARGAQKEAAGLFEAARAAYERALEAFRASLVSSPQDVRLLRNCARTLMKVRQTNILAGSDGS